MRVIPQRRLSRAAAFATALVLAGCEQNTLESSNGTTTAVPDLSGIWARNSLEFEEPASGPGPVTNLTRLSDGTSGVFFGRVGDYSNPILTPAAAEAVKRFSEIERSGAAAPDPDN
jgi:hypothetical protein